MSQKSGLHPLSRKHNFGMSPPPSRFRVKNEKKNFIKRIQATSKNNKGTCHSKTQKNHDKIVRKMTNKKYRKNQITTINIFTFTFFIWKNLYFVRKHSLEDPILYH